MKRILTTSLLLLLTVVWSSLEARDWPDEYLGLPGDNFNLYAAMKLFQESETLEGFERALNDENSRINNLDLNGDHMVDYIMVNDYVDGDVHNIVLRVALDRNETQDVAVFVVERLRDGSAVIQLIGDEALYGKNYIVEPVYDDLRGETPNPGYQGGVVRTTAVEVAAWPVVRFIFLPRYVAWHSSWYWGYRPVYWNPWRPYYWHYYYGYHSSWYGHYHRYYRMWDRPRYARYHDYYCSRVRVHSPLINININKGVYKSTYSRPELRREGEALYARTHGSRNGEGRNASAVRSGQNNTDVRTGRSRGEGVTATGGNRSVESRSGSRTGARTSTAPATGNRSSAPATEGRRSGGLSQGDRMDGGREAQNGSSRSGIGSSTTIPSPSADVKVRSGAGAAGNSRETGSPSSPAMREKSGKTDNAGTVGTTRRSSSSSAARPATSSPSSRHSGSVQKSSSASSRTSSPARVGSSSRGSSKSSSSVSKSSSSSSRSSSPARVSSSSRGSSKSSSPSVSGRSSSGSRSSGSRSGGSSGHSSSGRSGSGGSHRR